MQTQKQRALRTCQARLTEQLEPDLQAVIRDRTALQQTAEEYLALDRELAFLEKVPSLRELLPNEAC
jgi:hypothetical protein